MPPDHVEKSMLPRILVTDDDQTTRLVAAMSLKQAGFDVVEVDHGQACIEALSASIPDVLLLDVEMPGMDGFETCERVRAMEGCAHLPIVMITGSDDVESIERSYAAGATDFVTKPINWVILHHRLRYILRASDAIAQLSSTAEALATNQLKLSNAQRIAQLGSWDFDPESRDMLWSPEVYRILDLSPDVDSPSLATWLGRVAVEDSDMVEDWFADMASVLAPEPLTFALRLPGRTHCYAQLQAADAALLSQDHGYSYCGTVQDVTERVLAEQKVRRLAYYDGLTDLPNRAMFMERIEQEVARAARNDKQLAVLFLDIDDFKRINDTLGHAVGDKLLKEVASRLKECLRISDTITLVNVSEGENEVARLGGDEFVLLVPDIARAEDVGSVAERILERLSRPFSLDKHETNVSPSIGIALYPSDGDTPDKLIKNADTAMYFAKRQGKNRFHFFENSMNESFLRRLQLDNQLRRALEKEELSLCYQPQMDLHTGELSAVEALLRWHNDELGDVSPMEFIPLAEDTGLIIPIGEWVMRTACAQMKLWQEAGLPIQSISVNVSVAQFVQPNFPELVKSILDDSDLSPHCLELEITESLLVKDAESAIAVLNKLKDIGIRLSIDDFGTGYSSLSQLKCLPIDRLKIDRSFIREVTSDPDSAAITLAVMSMAKNMKLDVVAEGVEKEEQLAFLQARDCGSIQGFYLSRPLPATELIKLLNTRLVARDDAFGNGVRKKS